SGFTTDSIIKVVQGERVGTLFHQDASKWALPKEVSARGMAVSARECSRRLQSLSSEERKKILLDIADALEANEKLIRIENEADVSAAQQAGYEKSLISRLTLKPGKARDYEYMFFPLWQHCSYELYLTFISSLSNFMSWFKSSLPDAADSLFYYLLLSSLWSFMLFAIDLFTV
ncbi:hypothetical protein BHE74_00005626, partial [Ensete ventricosum]